MKRQIYCTAGPAGVPERATAGAAGFDLVASGESYLLPAHTANGPGTNVIDTDIIMAIPEGYYGQLASRSGLAFKKNITAFPGVIDSDYRGEVKVMLYNWGGEPQVINKGDRIAQLIILPCFPDIGFTFTEAKNLTKTARGEGGFGSTGTGTDYSEFATEDAKTIIIPPNPEMARPNSAEQGTNADEDPSTTESSR